MQYIIKTVINDYNDNDNNNYDDDNHNDNNYDNNNDNNNNENNSIIIIIILILISRLDFCNSLFYGIPNYFIHRLQKIQNTAASIVTRSVRSSHIAPILKSLNWLPANYRINSNICCITHSTLSLHGPRLS